jgi:hypothetical protein
MDSSGIVCFAEMHVLLVIIQERSESSIKVDCPLMSLHACVGCLEACLCSSSYEKYSCDFQERSVLDETLDQNGLEVQSPKAFGSGRQVARHHACQTPET